MISLLDAESLMRAPALPDLKNEIHLVRGERVMLDSALAEIYGVPTKQLNQQLKRNQKRFPSDFAFQLTPQEFTNLRSQFVTSSYGGRRYRPWVFTEHGAIMLASVLNSPVAIEASVRVVRAFVRLREMISANAELTRKFVDLEKRLDTNDRQIAQLFAAIRQLLAPTSAKKREIGFHVREKSARYRVKTKV